MDTTTPQPIAIVSENTTSPTPKGRKSLFVVLIILAVVVAFSAGVFAGYTFLQKNTQTQNADKLSSVESTATPTPSIADEGISYEKEYVSEKLGIKFTYSTITDPTYKWPVRVVEEGNRIQIQYQPNGGEFTTGQFVDVFEKDPEDTLETAIQKSVLSGYSLDDCLIVTNPGDQMDSGARFAVINVPNQQNLEFDKVFELASKCPSDYTVTNFFAFFYSNPIHKDKLLYFSLGQEGSTVLKNGKEWYQTVEFVN